jgi:hypothetical protein
MYHLDEIFLAHGWHLGMLYFSLASVNLTQGLNVFRWNLAEDNFFSVDSMYKALIQPIMPAFNNKMI